MSVLNQANFRRNVRLKNYTTFRIGGYADFLTEVKETKNLIDIMKSGEFDNIKILGKGSNVLVSDYGYRGLVVILKTDGIKFEGGLCIADAGLALSKLSKIYIDASYSGLEWACSIPGTIGGAVKMNAGAFGGCTADILEWVEILRNGETVRLKNEECGFGYRKSGLMSGDVILRAALKFAQGDKNNLLILRKKYNDFRRITQPSGYSAGSVFTAADKPAGWYIDNADLKGLKIGGAAVSKLHANFIINTGAATAKNVASLIDVIKAEIKVRFNVDLKEEIEYIGEF